MDLGTDYCYYAGVLLVLLRSLTQGVRWVFGEIDVVACLVACLLAGCLLIEGARGSLLLASDNACQV